MSVIDSVDLSDEGDVPPGAGTGWNLPDVGGMNVVTAIIKAHITDQQLPMEDINSFFKGEDDFPSWYDMRLFWIAYRDWLAARGFELHILRKYPFLYEEIWSPPPSTCPAPLPYAERCAEDASGSRPPSPYVSSALSAGSSDACAVSSDEMTAQVCPCPRQTWSRRHYQAGQHLQS